MFKFKGPFFIYVSLAECTFWSDVRFSRIHSPNIPHPLEIFRKKNTLETLKPRHLQVIAGVFVNGRCKSRIVELSLGSPKSNMEPKNQWIVHGNPIVPLRNVGETFSWDM